ncbi:hypothetical protein [Paraburkholderia sp. BL9I2N2]|jgi:hypothetical protein|uniref:hypothetical protein n=1 Tax=Paraburkholderia sp. BL9I2N2 TaxID=1938809 RepID=UPI001044CE69|nr:hypothetical protein [Paraburkholderia sp. BL9I2N2]
MIVSKGHVDKAKTIVDDKSALHVQIVLTRVFHKLPIGSRVCCCLIMQESTNRLRGGSNERSTDRGRGIILVRQITVLILMYGPRIFDKREKGIMLDAHRFANLLEESVCFWFILQAFIMEDRYYLFGMVGVKDALVIRCSAYCHID